MKAAKQARPKVKKAKQIKMKNRYMAKKNEIQETACMDVLFERISDLIEQARQRVMKSVNIAEVYTKFEIGRYIVDDE